jgi:hypothetical protein
MIASKCELGKKQGLTPASIGLVRYNVNPKILLRRNETRRGKQRREIRFLEDEP